MSYSPSSIERHAQKPTLRTIWGHGFGALLSVQQVPRRQKISGLEALGEPVVNRSEDSFSFVLPILFGAILDWLGINSSCFMFLYGVVWVSLILNYTTEVRRLPVMGEQVFLSGRSGRVTARETP